MTLELNIVQSFGWPYVFAIPGMLLLVCACAIALCVRASPADVGFDILAEPVPVKLIISPVAPELFSSSAEGEEGDSSHSKEARKRTNSFEHESSQSSESREALLGTQQANDGWANCRELLGSPLFICYLFATIFISCVRDGVVTWVLSFFADCNVSNEDAQVWLMRPSGLMAPPPSEAVGLAIFAGGAMGGVVLGNVSDKLFGGSRLEPMIIFTVAQGVAFWAFYEVSRHAAGPWVCTFFLFLNCFFTLGNYSMLAYAIPSDCGDRLASLAAGFQTLCCYLGSGLVGVVLGKFIEDFGFWSWAWAVELSTILMIVSLLVGRLVRKR